MILKINAENSGYDSSKGKAFISETTDIQSTSNIEGRIMNIENSVSAKNYTAYLEGGKIYYLHLIYNFNYNENNKFVINDISLIKGEKESLISSVQANGDYYFEEQNGALVSNNTKRNSTVANSYIRLDLTNSSDIDLEYIYNGIDANSFSFFRLEDILNSNKKEVKVGLPDITISEILPSGEIFLTGVLNNNTIISGESTVTGQDITLTKTGAEFDGIFIKTDVNGKIEIITQIKTNEIGNSSIIKAFKTADGYEIIGGYEGEIHIPAENTVSGEEVTLTAENKNNMFIAKLDNSGNIVWIKDFTYLIQDSEDILTLLYGIAQYSDDLLFTEITSPYGIYIPSEETINGEDLYLTGGNCYKIGINSEGKIASVEDNTTSVFSIFRTMQNIGLIQDNDFTQYYMKLTEKDSLLIMGHADNLYIPGEFMTSGVDFDAYDDYIVLAINSTGKVELAYSNYYPIFKAIEVEDGYVIVGLYQDGMYIPAKETVNGEEIIIESDSEVDYDMYIMKINKSGKTM